MTLLKQNWTNASPQRRSPMRFFNSDKQHNKQAKVSNSLPLDYANSLPTADSPTSTRRSRQSLCNICLSKHLRRFGLRESELALDSLLSKARSLESSETQAAGMELTAHRPPQLEEDVISVKGRYKKCPNSHIRSNGRPHTKHPGNILTLSPVKNVERNGHI